MPDYVDHLRQTRSIQLVTSLQKRPDLAVRALVEQFQGEIAWEPLESLLIDQDAWKYVTERFDPKLVLCHPQVLIASPTTSLYYRGMCGLSMKAAKDYFGAVEAIEAGNPRARLSQEKATRMARTYNAYICSIIKNSSDWTLENGFRTIVATIGITVDGSMRGKVGDIAEARVRTLLLEELSRQHLLVEPKLGAEQLLHPEAFPREFKLANRMVMRFGSDPDVSFERDEHYIAILEIKGGIDPAGALERYGAAKKTFEHAVTRSPRCETFLLTAVQTKELKGRVEADRLVGHWFDIIKMIEDPEYRNLFLDELLNHALRLFPTPTAEG
jgi:hypothetical protein